MMFRPERNASPFSLLDMDMWDSNFTAQSSAWCGMESVSGSEFMSKINTSSSSGSGSYRQNDPGLRKWQSLSHLAPNVSPRSLSPLPSSHLRTGRVQSPFRQSGVVQWLQEAQERMDSHMDRLRTDPNSDRLDMKQREKYISELEVFKVQRAQREAELRAKRQEEECKHTLQKLQTATEAQKTLLGQTTELKQRLTETIQDQSELQDQLRVANNKISQACLEKATLSTQVLKLEDIVLDLKSKLSAALHDKHDWAQEKAVLQEKLIVLELQLEENAHRAEASEPQKDLNPTETNEPGTSSLKQEIETLKQSKDDLKHELDVTKETLKESQVQVQELTMETASKAQQVNELETERAQMVIKMKESEQVDVEELKSQITKHSASSRSLKFENQKLQDRCLFLETEVFEKKQLLKLLEDDQRRAETERVQHTEKLKAMVSHWTGKWQKAALALQSTEAELGELRKKNKNESEALIRLELDACKQELELMKTRSRALLNRKEDGRTIQTEDKETLTDSSLLPSAFHLDLKGNQGKQLVQQTAGCNDQVQGCAEAQITEAREVELAESRHTKLELEKTLSFQKLQQQSLAKDGGLSAETRREQDIFSEQQHRLINEELKSLFKEKDQNEVMSNQNWGQMSTGTRAPPHERWGWHQGAGLMPVFEEEEPGDEYQDGEKMFPAAEKTSACEPQEPDMFRTDQTVRGLAGPAEQVPRGRSDGDRTWPDGDRTWPDGDRTWPDGDRTWPDGDRTWPDGIFQADVVDVCSSVEDEVD